MARIVVYSDPEIGRLRNRVAAARSRLAEIEADFTRDRRAVDATQAKLFNLVRDHYQKRDRLRLLVEYRRKYLKIVLTRGEDEAAGVAHEYKKEKSRSDSEYEQAAKSANGKKELSREEELEIKLLWKKLVILYHPDRFAGRPDTVETNERLTKAINQAKDEGNIDLLREIASDPNGFIRRQGWTSLDFSDEKELNSLRKLLATLTAEIVEKLEALNTLRESAEYELHNVSNRQPGLLDETAADLAKAISAEVAQLETEAEKLKREIDELTEAEEDAMVA
jgi:DNA polymerase-3 subunit epsilon